MKTIKFSVLLAVAITLVNCGIVCADLTPNQIVAQFNGLGTNGWSFTSGSSTERYFAPANAAFTPDRSAYHPNALGTGTNRFHTFCIEPNSPSLASSGTAVLNFSGGNSTRVSIDNKAVSVGTAFLYQQFATGAFSSSLYNYTNASQRASDYSVLLSTLRVLMEPQTYGSLNWSTNKFLAYLLTVNPNQSYWTGVYNPGIRYNEIGNYAVFVMNIHNASGGGEYQDFLYIARADYGGGGGGVPEPATLLLWTLGGIGAFGVGRYRKRG